MPNPVKISESLLWATIEEPTGLWALTWELNSLRPDIEEASNRHDAQQIITRFLDEGLVVCVRHHWGKNDFNEIALDEAKQLLNIFESWVAPHIDEVCISVQSTKKGEDFYHSS